MNLPFLKFYVRDWIGDPQLRMVSIASRGFWFECLCIMHMAKRRGYLETPSGQAINEEQLARLTGTFIGEIKGLKAELIEHGIPSVEDGTGTWYNRRMVNESQKAEKCSEAGRKGGGNPLLRKERDTKDQTPEVRDHISIKGTYKGESKGGSRFTPPTSEQVSEYAKSIDFPELDPNQFVDFYGSKGWMVGKSPMKDWKCAVRTWKRGRDAPKPTKALSPEVQDALKRFNF